MIRGALLLSLAALAGCGGGDDAPVVQLFGDSTQFLAAPYWQQRYPGQIDNQAVPGTSSGQLLAGADGKHAAWPAQVKADEIDVIKFGANDCLEWFHTSPEKFAQNLRELIAKAPGRVILETPDPTLDVDRPNEPAYVEVVRQVARETGATLIDTDACWRARADWPTLIGKDTEHATEEGRAFTVASCVAPVMDSIIGGAR